MSINFKSDANKYSEFFGDFEGTKNQANEGLRFSYGRGIDKSAYQATVHQWKWRYLFCPLLPVWGLCKIIGHVAQLIFVGSYMLLTAADTNYMLAKTFSLLRDVEEIIGYLFYPITRWGSFHIEQAQFQKNCYQYALDTKYSDWRMEKEIAEKVRLINSSEYSLSESPVWHHLAMKHAHIYNFSERKRLIEKTVRDIAGPKSKEERSNIFGAIKNIKPISKENWNSSSPINKYSWVKKEDWSDISKDIPLWISSAFSYLDEKDWPEAMKDIEVYLAVLPFIVEEINKSDYNRAEKLFIFNTTEFWQNYFAPHFEENLQTLNRLKEDVWHEKLLFNLFPAVCDNSDFGVQVVVNFRNDLAKNCKKSYILGIAKKIIEDFKNELNFKAMSNLFTALKLFPMDQEIGEITFSAITNYVTCVSDHFKNKNLDEIDDWLGKLKEIEHVIAKLFEISFMTKYRDDLINMLIPFSLKLFNAMHFKYCTPFQIQNDDKLNDYICSENENGLSLRKTIENLANTKKYSEIASLLASQLNKEWFVVSN